MNIETHIQKIIKLNIPKLIQHHRTEKSANHIILQSLNEVLIKLSTCLQNLHIYDIQILFKHRRVLLERIVPECMLAINFLKAHQPKHTMVFICKKANENSVVLQRHVTTLKQKIAFLNDLLNLKINIIGEIESKANKVSTLAGIEPILYSIDIALDLKLTNLQTSKYAPLAAPIISEVYETISKLKANINEKKHNLQKPEPPKPRESPQRGPPIRLFRGLKIKNQIDHEIKSTLNIKKTRISKPTNINEIKQRIKSNSDKENINYKPIKLNQHSQIPKPTKLVLKPSVSNLRSASWQLST